MPLEFWENSISAAMRMRTSIGLPSSQTDCFRLVHGEGDSLPGLVVDVYKEVAVLQAHSAGMYLSAMRQTSVQYKRTDISSMSTGRRDRRPVSFWIREIAVSWWASTQKGGRSLIYSVIQEDSPCMP